jgi:large subunit ribosomal protein L9
MMKIVLIQNVSNLGKAGDIKNVADGYAANFLLPRKLAAPATKENIQKAEQDSRAREQQANDAFSEVKEKARKIQGLKLLIRAKTKEEKLFGSVGAKDIAKSLKEKGFDVEPGQIKLQDPIKVTGEKEVDIELTQGITAKIFLEIIPE